MQQLMTCRHLIRNNAWLDVICLNSLLLTRFIMYTFYTFVIRDSNTTIMFNVQIVVFLVNCKW
jgi:uncharacterized membrane protein